MRRMRSDTRCRRRRAVGEGAAVARELGGGDHGRASSSASARHRERARAQRKGRGSEGESPWCSITSSDARGTWQRARAHGVHVHNTRRSLRQNSEQVAGDDEGGVGSRLRPSRVRIGHWA